MIMRYFDVFTLRELCSGKISKKHIVRVGAMSHKRAKEIFRAGFNYRGKVVSREIKKQD